MNAQRFSHSAVIVHGLIYAIGGIGTDTVEIYEPRMDRWIDGPSLTIPRCCCSAVRVGHRILVVEGNDDGSTEILHLIPEADCSVSARYRAISSSISKSVFDLRFMSAEYLVGEQVVAPLEAITTAPSNRSLLEDLGDIRPLSFPVPNFTDMQIDISNIEIDDSVWVGPSRLRLLVVGNARVGKTSLIKNLSSGGTEFDPTENSTEVGDVRTLEIPIRKHVWTDTTTSIGTTLLKRMVQRHVANREQETRTPLRNTDGSSTPQPSTGESPVIGPASAQVDDLMSATTAIQEPSASASPPSPNVARETVTARERINVASRVLTDLEKDTLSVSILDFAGQNVFRVFDPLFFGKQSLYFCVFSLRDLYAAHQTGTLEKAIESNIFSWLRIIANVGACNATKEEKLMSKVVLIGTHGNSYAASLWDKVRSFLSSLEWDWQKTFLDACNSCLGKVLVQPQFKAFFEVQQFSDDRWFIVVEKDSRQRKNGQKPMMEWLSKEIEEFHRRLPKVLLRNLVLEQMCRDCKDVVLAVDQISVRIPGIAALGMTPDEIKEGFDDLVALGCFFACSSDGHMIVLRPDVFIRTCAQLIPPTDGKGGLLHVGHSKRVIYKDLLEYAGIIQYETAKGIMEGYLLVNKICPVDSHRLVAEQVLAMLVTLGVVVPMDQESKLVYFPQWHRHCDPHTHAPVTLGIRWTSICSNTAAATPVSLSVRCIGCGVLAGMYDGVVTDLHFWRFITFLGKRGLYPNISLNSPPALGLDVIVCRPASSLRCRIRLDREKGASSIFHFDTLSSPHATGVPDMFELLTAFLNEDPMSRSVLSCELVATSVTQSEFARGPSLSSRTRTEFIAAFDAQLIPFLRYFVRHYDAVFKNAVHALYNISPGQSDTLLEMDDREQAVKKWMKKIVLNPKHEDALPRFHQFLSQYPAVLAEVNAILFPPAASIPTRVASQAPTSHGSASSSVPPAQPARLSPGVGIILTVTPEEGTAFKVAFIQLCDIGKAAKKVSGATRNRLLESLCGNENPVLADLLDPTHVSVECVEASAKLSEDQVHPLEIQTFIFRNKGRGNTEVYRLHHINFGDVQGSVHFAVVVPQLLLHFKPSHVLVSGVCAGYPGYNDIGFGTVVVATDVFSVTRGKATHEGMKFDIERITLNSAPGANLQALISNTVSVWNAKIEDPSSGIATFIAASSTYGKMLNSNTNGIPIKANALTGSIGCAVDHVKEDLQNKAGWDQLRRDTASRKLRAIEMEGVGIAKAIENEPRKPIFLFQKAVMDFAGSRTDAAKPYASFTSALFAAQFLFCSVLPGLYE
eukprot:ANDGO_01445.mRNA.1 hypothetical protein